MLPEPLDRVTPTHVAIGLSAVSALIITICTISAYSVDTPLPPPGPPPVTVEKASMRNYRFMPSFFRSLTEEDAQKLELPKVSLKAIGRPNVLRKEFTGSQALKPGASFQTATIDLKAMQQRLWLGREGQRVRAKHLVLRITNRGDRPVAYRVQTEVTVDEQPADESISCSNKAAIAHNAIALRPGQSIERTECLLSKRTRLFVRRVEVLELTPLGYHYVSRLEPRALLFPARTSEEHEPARLPLCRLLPWPLIKTGLGNGHFAWYDVVDFYSRHNCDEYTFFASYRWSASGPGQLPRRPE